MTSPLLALLCAVLPCGGLEPPAEAPAATSPTEQLAVAIEGATEWLLANQRPDGAWGSHHSARVIEVLCDVPGSHHAFRVATTSLCVMALSDGPRHDEAVRRAIDRGLAAILADHDVKRPSGFEHYGVWAFGYALQCLGEQLLQRPDHPRADEIRAVSRRLVSKLERAQCLDGGWSYLSLHEVPTQPPSWTSMSFTTATMLVGLHRAQQAGLEVPREMVRKAVNSIRRCRTPTGSYTYGEMWNRAPVSGINQIKGAACRTPCCQYAMERFGTSISPRDHTRSLDDLLVRHTRFQRASLRRPIPHESHYAISGYFYLFGHAYAAYVLEELPEEVQLRYGPALLEGVLQCVQPDGSFWDYPLYSYHKPYGTAYALIALSRVRLAETRP